MDRCKVYIVPFDLDNDVHECFHRALIYLNTMGASLTFGDIVQFSGITRLMTYSGVAIFDGKNFAPVQLHWWDSIAPKKFKVLELNQIGKRFPISYWENFVDKVWFDHRPYIDQIIKGITYDTELFNGKYSIYTHFIFEDGRKIYILYLPTAFTCWDMPKLEVVGSPDESVVADSVDPTIFGLSPDKVNKIIIQFKNTLGDKKLLQFDHKAKVSGYPNRDDVLYLT